MITKLLGDGKINSRRVTMTSTFHNDELFRLFLCEIIITLGRIIIIIIHNGSENGSQSDNIIPIRVHCPRHDDYIADGGQQVSITKTEVRWRSRMTSLALVDGCDQCMHDDSWRDDDIIIL